MEEERPDNGPGEFQEVSAKRGRQIEGIYNSFVPRAYFSLASLRPLFIDSGEGFSHNEINLDKKISPFRARAQMESAEFVPFGSDNEFKLLFRSSLLAEFALSTAAT